MTPLCFPHIAPPNRAVLASAGAASVAPPRSLSSVDETVAQLACKKFLAIPGQRAWKGARRVACVAGSAFAFLLLGSLIASLTGVTVASGVGIGIALSILILGGVFIYKKDSKLKENFKHIEQDLLTALQSNDAHNLNPAQVAQALFAVQALGNSDTESKATTQELVARLEAIGKQMAQQEVKEQIANGLNDAKTQLGNLLTESKTQLGNVLTDFQTTVTTYAVAAQHKLGDTAVTGSTTPEGLGGAVIGGVLGLAVAAVVGAPLVAIGAMGAATGLLVAGAVVNAHAVPALANAPVETPPEAVRTGSSEGFQLVEEFSEPVKVDIAPTPDVSYWTQMALGGALGAGTAALMGATAPVTMVALAVGASIGYMRTSDEGPSSFVPVDIIG